MTDQELLRLAALAAMARYLDMCMPPPLLSITERCGIPSMAPALGTKTHGCGWWSSSGLIVSLKAFDH